MAVSLHVPARPAARCRSRRVAIGVAWSAVAAIVLMLVASRASAITATVGIGAGCTHNTVQAALNSVVTAAEPSLVRITRSATYAQQALSITVQHNLEITGGHANCQAIDSDAARTVLDGEGGLPASVLRIVSGAGVTVTLRKLRLQHGDPSGANPGGGLFFGGSGRLIVRQSDIVSNIAGNGGGIYAGGATPGAELVIGEDVIVSGNEARFSGGGVFIDGLTMTMVEPGSALLFNSARGTSDTGYGGGLLIRNLEDRGALARIGTSGSGSLGAVYGNEARAGGGIAIIGQADLNADVERAKLELFGTLPGQPVAVRSNLATVAGGGIFQEGRFGFFFGGQPTHAVLWNAAVDDNIAPSGAAIYVATHSNMGDEQSSELFINQFRPDGAAACAGQVPHCGSISRNFTTLENGTFTDGAVIQIQRGSTGRIGTSQGGIDFRGNQGGRLVDVQEASDARPVSLTLENAAIVDNVFSQHLLRAAPGDIQVRDVTVAGNSIASTTVFGINANLDLRRSVLWQPDMTLLQRSGGTLNASSLLVSEATGLAGVPQVEVTDPRFVDRERGDYRLRASSRAVDYAGVAGGRDIAGENRDVDLAFKPNAVGPRDLGAYERFGIGELMHNGFFAGDLHQWAVVSSGAVAYDPAQDAGGPAGSGSVHVAGTPGADNQLAGLRQCVHLPGPGEYVLGAHAQVAFDLGTRRDTALLRWELRTDGGEACDVGTVTGSGTHIITRSTAWSTAEPARIPVPASSWTPNASLTVTLAVIDNGISVPQSAEAWFDAVSLRVEALVDVFADGFE